MNLLLVMEYPRSRREVLLVRSARRQSGKSAGKSKNANELKQLTNGKVVLNAAGYRKPVELTKSQIRILQKNCL
jgi:hypothetical protein